jgi:hypothetical protein
MKARLAWEAAGCAPNAATTRGGGATLATAATTYEGGGARRRRRNTFATPTVPHHLIGHCLIHHWVIGNSGQRAVPMEQYGQGTRIWQ